MLDEAKRQAYLKAMDITEWQLRSSDDVRLTDDSASVIAATQDTVETTNPDIPDHQLKASNIDTDDLSNAPSSEEPRSEESMVFAAKGLTWLNTKSHNGLLVVLSEQRKALNPESRQLMSNMLKSIHFLPTETGFASIADKLDSSEPAGSLESVKAILVFGNDAGRDLVKVAGARIIPGTEVFSLGGKKIVVSLHPDEIIAEPSHKKQAWADLKQLVEFFNNG